MERKGTRHFLLFLIASLYCLQILHSEEAPKRPKYKLVQRYKEDWSSLHEYHKNQDYDCFDPIKYIPLDRCGTAWVSFGGHARARVEAWDHFVFRPTKSSDTYLLTRLFLHGDLHVTDRVRLFVEGKYANSTDRDLPGGKRTLDVDILDLQNAFFDIYHVKSSCIDVFTRVGRQELLFGKQRFISPLDWANTRRTFTGVSEVFVGDKWDATVFWTKLVRVRKYDFNDNAGQGDFFGIYGTIHPCPSVGIDLYWLERTRKSATFNTKTGRETRHTIGSRVFGEYDERFVYDLEAAYQFGDLGNFDICAWMLAIDGAYKFPDLCWSPLFGIGFDYASGDNINNTKKSRTFSHLFPLGHAFLGYIDIIGRQNIIDTHPYLTFFPYKDLKTTIHYHYFLRANDKDALYNAGAGVVFPATAGTSEHVGSEIDVTLYYPLTTHLSTEFGYCHFFKGTFVEQALARSKSIDFAYLSLVCIF